MRWGKSAISCAALVSLAACSNTSYPSLYTAPAPVTAEQTTNLGKILASAAEAQKTYNDAYIETAKNTDATQLPLIVAAALAAGFIYQGHNDALDNLAILGIGTAAYTTTRSTFSPPRLAELYIQGHSALGCIRTEGSLFNGASATQQRANFQTVINILTTDVRDGKGLYEQAQLDAAATDDEKRSFQLAMSGLNQAILGGAQTLATAVQQNLAFDMAESVFGTAVANVHTRVATAARTGRVMDLAAMRQQFTANIEALGAPLPAAAGGGAPALAGAPSNANVIVAVQRAANKILESNQRLVSATPDYAGAIARVRACPAIVQ